MRGLLLALALFTAVGLAVAAVPALAQTADLPGGGRSSPPDYAFDDGTVVIGGDTATTCPSFASFLETGYFESGDTSAGARRVLERCVEAGLLDRELAASAAGGEDGGLPDTGGPDLPALLAVLGVLALAGGLLSRSIARE